MFRGSIDKVTVTNFDTCAIAEAGLIECVGPKTHVRFSGADFVTSHCSVHITLVSDIFI
jgi:hypothetical protein